MNNFRVKNFHRGWNYSLVSVIVASLILAVLIYNDVSAAPFAKAVPTDCGSVRNQLTNSKTEHKRNHLV